MLPKGVAPLHDVARPHTAASTYAVMRLFNWQILVHPPYSPDRAPSDYRLFTKRMACQRFHTDEELMGGANSWQHNLAVRSVTGDCINWCHGTASD